MSDLSAEIMEGLWDKEYPRWYLVGECRLRLPQRDWESYGEEPKRFTWAKLSCEYSWEDCI